MTDRYYVFAGVVTLGIAVSVIAARRVAPAEAAPADTIGALLGGRQTRSTIVVVLNMRDCSSRIEGLRQLNRVASSHGVRIRGVLLGRSNGDRSITDLLDGSGIGFPVAGDSSQAARHVVGMLGYVRTPVILAFDGNGQLRYAQSLSPTEERWAAADIQLAVRLASDARPLKSVPLDSEGKR